ncbi:MAG TPA: electron transfer flavoprotein subunit beta/FixA family protein [Acidimicrobiia bacterium]|nr:electron transfer flavoprotein subunit beta/FixA family protein [Acidimicrobiia bacterium]
MKVVVCVKHVPVGRVRMLPDTHRLDRSGPGEINEFDKHALEEAIRIGERDGAEVVVVSVGPAEADESLRTALALGVDRAVLVSDAGAAGSDLLATAAVLAAVLEREAADLVLFGQQSSDSGGGALWAAVAEKLHRPFVSQASAVTLADGRITVRRETEYGNDVIEAPLPALVAVSDAINEPRYASLKGRMGAKKKPLDVLTIAELGLDPSTVGATGSTTEVLAVGPPPARGATVTIDDEAGAAEAIYAYLHERELV